MPTEKMHADQVETDADLVRRLLAAQFPQWAGLPIERLRSAGTDNAIYRLGGTMVVRMPRIGWARGQVDADHQWLPRLAPLLQLAIPTPIARGRPGDGYPWNWAVHNWLAGENATLDRLVDPHQAAVDLAGFVKSLWKIDTTGGPLADAANSGRGVPLGLRDESTRAGIDSLKEEFHVRALTAIWDAALAAPVWNSPAVWLHGDLQPGNLLATEGRLCGVIDFGCLGVGDPACDLMPAWNLLPPEARSTFRANVEVDEATWTRGRGWALSVAVIALPYYQKTNPVLANISRRAIAATLADQNSDV